MIWIWNKNFHENLSIKWQPTLGKPDLLIGVAVTASQNTQKEPNKFHQKLDYLLQNIILQGGPKKVGISEFYNVVPIDYCL